jgi:hypothetical protein
VSVTTTDLLMGREPGIFFMVARAGRYESVVAGAILCLTNGAVRHLIYENLFDFRSS